MSNNSNRKNRIISDQESDIPDNTIQNLISENNDSKKSQQSSSISKVTNDLINLEANLKQINLNNNHILSYNTNNANNNSYNTSNTNNNLIKNNINNNLNIDKIRTNVNYNNEENIPNNNNLNNNYQIYYETNSLKSNNNYDNNNYYLNPEFQKLINERQNWSGSNYFPMNGNILEGPCSFRPTLMSSCAISAPIFLFIFFNIEFFKKELTIIVPIFIILLYLATIIFILIATFVDPGIIRRYPIEKDGGKGFKEKKIFHLGNIFTYKYCQTCNIIRPMRSTHCFDCNNCVERLDHHCPWIGNCAGKRNYKYFFIFLILLNILTICLIILSIFHVVKNIKDQINKNDKNKINRIAAYSMSEVIISLYIIIYCGLSMIFTTSLLFLHIRLVCSNTLTKESLKHFWENVRKNPFTRKNIKTNLKDALNPKIKKCSILDIFRGIKEPPDYIEIENNISKNDNKDDNNDNDDKSINNSINPTNKIIILII